MKVKGSYTVETALLMPMILGTLFFLIFLSYYVHDRTVLQGAVYETAMFGAGLCPEEREGMEEKLHKKLRDNVKGKLLISASIQEKVEVKTDEITVSCKSYVKKAPNSFVRKLSANSWGNIAVKQKAIIAKPAKLIRAVRKVREIKGVRKDE